MRAIRSLEEAASVRQELLEAKDAAMGHAAQLVRE